MCPSKCTILLTQSGVMNDTTKSVINLSSRVTGIYMRIMSFWCWKVCEIWFCTNIFRCIWLKSEVNNGNVNVQVPFILAAWVAHSVISGVHQEWMSLGLEVRCLLCNLQVLCLCFTCTIPLVLLCTSPVEQISYYQHTEILVMHSTTSQLEASLLMYTTHLLLRSYSIL